MRERETFRRAERAGDLSGRKSLVDKDVAVGGTLLVTEPR
jgi:hypothetical protein